MTRDTMVRVRLNGPAVLTFTLRKILRDARMTAMRELRRSISIVNKRPDWTDNVGCSASVQFDVAQARRMDDLVTARSKSMAAYRKLWRSIRASCPIMLNAVLSLSLTFRA